MGRRLTPCSLIFCHVPQGYMTELDFARLQLPPRALRFLQEHMPPSEGTPVDGEQTAHNTTGEAWDYEGFLDQFLE